MKIDNIANKRIQSRTKFFKSTTCHVIEKRKEKTDWQGGEKKIRCVLFFVGVYGPDNTHFILYYAIKSSYFRNIHGYKIKICIVFVVIFHAIKNHSCKICKNFAESFFFDLFIFGSESFTLALMCNLITKIYHLTCVTAIKDVSVLQWTFPKFFHNDDDVVMTRDFI